MGSRSRSNPLALAVLISLCERPMHPYEVATQLRERGKQESVRLNYGSLYSVVQTLEKRGLIEAHETEREGRLPERTVYHLTPAGEVEMHDWLSDLLSSPQREYPDFEAALSFLPALPPDEVVSLLQGRAQALEVDVTRARAVEDLLLEKGLPRLFWVEAEFATMLKQAELDFVRQLIKDIATGSLDGTKWWRRLHEAHAAGEEPEDHPPFEWFPTEGDER